MRAPLSKGEIMEHRAIIESLDDKGQWVNATNKDYGYDEVIAVRDNLKSHFPRMTFRINYGDNLEDAAYLFGSLLK
jgi:hypothetical protein